MLQDLDDHPTLENNSFLTEKLAPDTPTFPTAEIRKSEGGYAAKKVHFTHNGTELIMQTDHVVAEERLRAYQDAKVRIRFASRHESSHQHASHFAC